MGAIINNIPIPDKASGCDQWVNYHKVLLSRFPRVNANAIFMKTWQMNYSSWSACGSDPAFKAYFDKQGIDVGGSFADMAAEFSGIKDSILGTVGNTAKVVSYAVPVTLVAVLGLSAYFLFKAVHSGNAEKAALAALTKGAIR